MIILTRVSTVERQLEYSKRFFKYISEKMLPKAGFEPTKVE